ncbi:MAG TPA: NADH:ubiquinone reductase (Na(+)-transporting) subunit D [Flavobacteriales bacterium]|nr:NADH:ubiquinone reductase (Na(+)-transporting) subunit D [Flavobacteriales bacterium]
MSEVAVAEKVKELKEPLFSKKNRALISNPLDDDNPITVQVLGICSALAITVQLKQAVVMSVSVLFVLAAGNVIVSLMRNLIPNRIRIIVQLVIVAALVILVDQVLKAYVYDVSKALSVFVGLIITNCIIMGRLEAFALANKPWPAFLDGVGNALAYGGILVIVSFFRELLGSGKLWGYPVFGQKVGALLSDGTLATEASGLYAIGYVDNGLMILPPMALITVGALIWVQRARNTKLIEA